MKPDFICIGAHKAGTSWLWNQLKMHPEVWVPPNKELHYFDRFSCYSTSNELKVSLLKDRLRKNDWVEHSKKIICQKIDKGHPNVIRWWFNYLFSDYSDDWYLSLFDHVSPNKIKGEITPSYSILSAEHIAEMANLIPHTKIIFLLRNPIDRAWSMLRFSVMLGQDIDCTKDSEIISWLDADAQNLRSDYQRSIQLYSQEFGKDNILIGFYDAIRYQPEKLMAEILDFIGVSNPMLDKLNLSKIANASPQASMSRQVLEHLENKYRAPINHLADAYGSYCQIWLKSLEHKKTDNVTELELLKPSFRLSNI